MTITLTWDDVNSGSIQEDGFRVYRDTSTFTSSTLPAVLATLAADVETYEDTTTVAGTNYFYMIETFRGSLSKFTDIVEIQDAISTNLPIVNGDAEGGATGWTYSGDFQIINNTTGGFPGPFEGSNYFYGGNAALSTAVQDVDIPSGILTDVDNGDATLTIEWMQASFAGNDEGNISVDFLNVSDVIIGSNAGPGLLAPTPGNVYVSRSISGVAIPANTRAIRITMTAERNDGTSNDAYFDAVTGRILTPP